MTKLKTIIIDDEPDAIISIELVIKDFCPDLTVVGRANLIDDGWELIKNLQPDLILLDIEMPRGDGFDLLERFPIRKFDVIFITAHSNLKEQAAKYESFCILEKPVDIDVFQQIIKNLVEFRKNNPGKLYKRLSGM